MNCIDFELGVQSLLDSRQTELPAELRSHHDACADCRSFYAAQEVLVAMAREWRPSSPASTEIIKAAWAELAPAAVGRQPASVSSSRSQGRLWGAMCSAAAIVVLAVTLLKTPTAPRELVSQTDPSPLPVDAAVVSDALTGLLQGMNADYAALPAQTQQALHHIRDLADSAPLLPDFPEPERQIIQQPVEWRRWDRPVSERVGQAFGFLWDALPQTSERSS